MTRHGRARDRVQAVSLVVAAAGTAIVGIWAVITPLGFYRSFPGAGHHWVDVDGPYNRHLVSDVGLLSLALTLTLLVALWKREKVPVRTASVAALVFAAPHLAYHASHLGQFSSADATLEMVVLAITVLAPLVALITTSPGQGPENAAP